MCGLAHRAFSEGSDPSAVRAPHAERWDSHEANDQVAAVLSGLGGAGVVSPGGYAALHSSWIERRASPLPAVKIRLDFRVTVWYTYRYGKPSLCGLWTSPRTAAIDAAVLLGCVSSATAPGAATVGLSDSGDDAAP
jgi:hypothetical protein